MQLKTFRHLWGVHEPFEKVFPLLKKSGYDGVEFKGSKVAGDSSFRALLKEYRFEFISQIHTEGESVNDHIASFKHLVQNSLCLNPIKINSQSGKDRWGFDEKNEFIVRALQFEKKIGIPIAHEIHRGRITYNPWDTRDLLLGNEDLKLCCDFSHWVCVCERLLGAELSIIKLCAERCNHLHSRVGYEQGPQVSDPRAPEYATHLSAHEAWWDIIWQTQKSRGEIVSTLTPEFGPPEYQPTLPYRRTPVSNLWAICDWMAARQKERFHHLLNNQKDAKRRNYLSAEPSGSE